MAEARGFHAENFDDEKEIRLANNVLQAVFDLEVYRRKVALDELAKSLE